VGSASKLKRAAAFVPATERGRAPERPSPLALAFGCDLRALALFRIGLGFLVLADLWVRAHGLIAHYTDFGTLPRAQYLELFANPWELSFHHATGHVYGMVALFGLHAAVAVALLVGWRTRLATFLTWAFVVSLQNRNPVILHAGDVVLRMILFWAMFLPLGARASVDAALAPKESDVRGNDVLVNVATVALLLQIFSEYFFAALFKRGPEWHSAGNAVFYALSVEQFATSFGVWFRETFRWALPFLTRAVWWFELLGPFLLFAPFRDGLVRLAVALAFMSMHLAFELTLGIGTFPFICIVGLVPFLPPKVFDRWDRWIERRERPGRLVYAAGSSAARRGTAIVRELLFLRRSTVESSTEARVSRAIEYRGAWLGDWAFVDGAGNVWHQSDALLAAMDASPIFRPFALVARRRPFRWGLDAFYSWAVRLGTAYGDRWLPFAPNEYRLGPRSAVLVGALALYCFSWNVDSLAQGTALVPSSLRPVASVLRVDQRWNMFSRPILEDGWFVYEGKLQDGMPFDVKTGRAEAPSFDRPKLVSAEFPDERWQKYLMNLQQKNHEKHRLLFGRYLCRRINLARPEGRKLESFDWIFVMEKLTGEGSGRVGPTRQVLWRHRCFETPPEGALSRGGDRATRG
jgi:hypothetical protein